MASNTNMHTQTLTLPCIYLLLLLYLFILLFCLVQVSCAVFKLACPCFYFEIWFHPCVPVRFPSCVIVHSTLTCVTCVFPPSSLFKLLLPACTRWFLCSTCFSLSDFQFKSWEFWKLPSHTSVPLLWFSFPGLDFSFLKIFTQLYRWFHR